MAFTSNNFIASVAFAKARVGFLKNGKIRDSSKFVKT